MADTPPSAAPASGRGLRIALAVSVTLNLLIAGLVAGAVLRDGPPGGYGGERDFNFGPVAEALRPEDRKALRRELLQRAPSLRDARRQMRADQAAFIALLRSDPLDPVQLEAVMAAQNTRLEAQLRLGGEALRAMILAMPAQERIAFADRLDHAMSRGPEGKGKD